MPQMVIGVIQNETDANTAITHLENSGFDTKDISIMMRDQEKAKALAEGTGTQVAKTATSGATTGAVLGGIAGLLVGIGAITIPGFGGLLVGGPLAATLGLTGGAASTFTGAATGALTGGVIGALVGLGIPHKQAKVYEEKLATGAILIAVPTTTGTLDRAMDILQGHGATDLHVIPMHQASEALEDDEFIEEEPSYRKGESAAYLQTAGRKGGASRRRTRS